MYVVHTGCTCNIRGMLLAKTCTCTHVHTHISMYAKHMWMCVQWILYAFHVYAIFVLCYTHMCMLYAGYLHVIDMLLTCYIHVICWYLKTWRSCTYKLSQQYCESGAAIAETLGWEIDPHAQVREWPVRPQQAERRGDSQ